MQTAGLSESEIYKTFGETYASRGDFYVRSKRVFDVGYNVSSRILTGRVQGSKRSPYKVQMVLDETESKIRVRICSCPMGGLCKHSAAVALYAIRTNLISLPKPKGAYPNVAFVGDQRAAGPAQDTEEQLEPLNWHLTRWVNELATILSDPAPAFGATTKPERGQTEWVLYLLEVNLGRLVLRCEKSRKLKSGAWGGTTDADILRIAENRALYITDEDANICALFSRGRGQAHWSYRAEFPEIPTISQILLERMIGTGRCFWHNVYQPIRAFGPPKESLLSWELLDGGSQTLKFSTTTPDDIVATAGGIWYINVDAGVIGPLTTTMPPEAVTRILQIPKVSQEDASALAVAMERAGLNIPRPVGKHKIKTELIKPKPRLRLFSIDHPAWEEDVPELRKSSLAELQFDYGDIKFEHDEGKESRTISGDEILVRRRDIAAERKYFAVVSKFNLGDGFANSHDEPSNIIFDMYVDEDDIWLKFVHFGIPELEAAGFTVSIEDSFKYKIAIPEEEWDVQAKSGSGFWFALDLGVLVDGKRVPLLPIIHKALGYLDGLSPSAEIDRLNVDGKFYAPLPEGGFVVLPFERVKAIVFTLLEIFDNRGPFGKAAPQVNLPQIIELNSHLGNATFGSGLSSTKFSEGSALSSLLERIKNFDGLKAITPPSMFKAQLRPYQLEGLSWLDFIREFGLGGILADDMGLGKTIQTLAHIACEKKAKRVSKPYLVICPTSVLPNWISEVKKFAPDFKVLALAGSERMYDYNKIAKVDIVVTTYPLVPRDIAVLQEQEWQAVILDEAQYIKNPQTQVAQAVQLLHSEYRLCLTGTPIENHLGELWSQFNFLMPGFLRDLKIFNKTMRTPIEKQKNTYLQKHLANKVRPFLLRRTKEVVAKDLPEKTEIVKTVELEGAQRDLYESVRLAMYEKVKDALAEKGLARSQIVILDALLKLRQVCCDPRLVKLPTARQVKSSAKLDLLMEMIEELVDEGKRILLFSQFTSMLDLIEPELDKREIDYVQIRGDTKDRATPVQQFQNGKVPIFLLSLKAGGTGLNLTAADTVIHFDPWWNPAVENQATDRAHRIGQEKKVFVFKIIAAGTIEEKMLELQDKKRKIASAIYGDEEAIASKLTAEDLAELFTPLKS